MGLTSESSSEDDDTYLNPAARLKALKKKTSAVVDNDQGIEEDDDTPNFWRSKTFEPTKETTLPDRNLRSCKEHRGRPSKKKETEIVNCDRDSSPEMVETVLKDNKSQKFSNSIDSLNCSSLSVDIEDDNYHVVVKVKWRSRQMVRLELRKYEPFEKIFNHFAKLEGVSPQQVLIWRGSQAIHKTDTPASIDLTIIDILEGGIVDSEMAGTDQQQQQNTDDSNLCKIKVQMSTKQKINVNLKMDETFKTVILTCSEQLGVKPSQIKLSFDGDDIAATDTPESLDLEQEACIDLRLLKT